MSIFFNIVRPLQSIILPYVDRKIEIKKGKQNFRLTNELKRIYIVEFEERYLMYTAEGWIVIDRKIGIQKDRIEKIENKIDLIDEGYIEKTEE